MFHPTRCSRPASSVVRPRRPGGDHRRRRVAAPLCRAAVVVLMVVVADRSGHSSAAVPPPAVSSPSPLSSSLPKPSNNDTASMTEPDDDGRMMPHDVAKPADPQQQQPPSSTGATALQGSESEQQQPTLVDDQPTIKTADNAAELAAAELLLIIKKPEEAAATPLPTTTDTSPPFEHQHYLDTNTTFKVVLVLSVFMALLAWLLPVDAVGGAWWSATSVARLQLEKDPLASSLPPARLSHVDTVHVARSGAWSWGIAVTCMALHVGRREVTSPLARLSSVHLTVDGNSVVGGPFSEGRRPWVLITALFHHSGRTHVVNNMLMLLATGGELETLVSGPAVLCLFVLTGAAGWLCTLLYYRIVLPEAWAAGIAQMQPSVGASPATYGLAMFAMVRLPPSVPIGGALGMAPWGAASALLFVPKFMGDEFGLNITGAPLRRVLAAALAATLVSWLVVRPAMAWLGAHGVAEFMCFYLFVCTLPPAIRKWWCGQPNVADHSCHLGGALAGLVLATVWPWPTVAVVSDLLEPPSWTRRRGLLLCACMGELIARVGVDAHGKLSEQGA